MLPALSITIPHTKAPFHTPHTHSPHNPRTLALQILEQLLPFVRMGQVDEIMVEVMPGNWKHRGADTARGTAVLSELQRLSNATLLLYDPAPFGMSGMRQVPPSELGPGGSEVPGPLYSGFKAADLVQDRLGHDATPGFQGIPHGCNIWFVVNGRPLKQRGLAHSS